MDAPSENLLKRMPHCAYYKGKFKSEGTVLIFTDKIVFEPDSYQASALFGMVGAVFEGGVKNEICIRDIMRAERHKVMGVNCCMKIFTKDGVSHVYSLWPFRKELDGIIELINKSVST